MDAILLRSRPPKWLADWLAIFPIFQDRYEQVHPLNSPPLNILLPHHRQRLHDKDISDSVIEARGYYSITNESDLANFGYSSSQLNLPALVIPIRNIYGAVSGHQIWPDRPQSKRDKQAKYKNTLGSKSMIDIHPAFRRKVCHGTDGLYITNNIQEADRLVSVGLTCIDLIGEYNYQMQDDFWHGILLSRREITIVFDSVTTNRRVSKAATALAAHLRSLGAFATIAKLSVTLISQITLLGRSRSSEQ